MAKKNKYDYTGYNLLQREELLFCFANDEGLECNKMSPFHFRLKKGKKYVDLWPVSNTYWNHSMKNGSQHYRYFKEVLPYLNYKNSTFRS